MALYLTVVKSTCERRKISLTIQVLFGRVVVVALHAVVNSSELNCRLPSGWLCAAQWKVECENAHMN